MKQTITSWCGTRTCGKSLCGNTNKQHTTNYMTWYMHTVFFLIVIGSCLLSGKCRWRRHENKQKRNKIFNCIWNYIYVCMYMYISQWFLCVSLLALSTHGIALRRVVLHHFAGDVDACYVIDRPMFTSVFSCQSQATWASVHAWSAVTLLVLQHGPLGSPRSLYFLWSMRLCMYVCM